MNKNSFHSGFVTLVGKPNVGKSTLVNRLLAQKVSIVSSKPQTTRHRILGVKHGKNYQIVFVDLPGFLKPTDQLGKYMRKTIREETEAADILVFMVDASHHPQEEDLKGAWFVKSEKESRQVPLLLVINKTDLAKEEEYPARKEAFLKLIPFDEMVEISALHGKNTEELIQKIVKFLPEGPPFFDREQNTDQSPEFRFAEIVREKVLSKTRQEVPHGVFVVTEDIRDGATPDTLYVRAVIYVEKKNHKMIIIGKDGAKLKIIGTMAREEIEKITGKKVFIDLWVKVKEDWKDRKDLLKSWGYQ